MGPMHDQAWVKPEIEAFDTGHLWYAKQLGLRRAFWQPSAGATCAWVCPGGRPMISIPLMAMVNNIPRDWVYSAFSIGRHQMPFVAAAVLSGANVRVGLEDNLWLEKGRLASNAELVERAVTIVEAMGVGIMTPAEVRAELNLTRQDPP